MPYILLEILLIVLIGMALIGLSRPSSFRVERSIKIHVAPRRVFTVLSDFHQSESWSPWEKRDLQMVKIFGGPQSGRGATYEWKGNKNVGHGRQEIVDVAADSKIVIKLDFYRPFKGTKTTEFLLEPEGDATIVRWIMYGPLHFIVRVLGFNMDNMIGKDFETGLMNLKSHLEQQ